MNFELHRADSLASAANLTKMLGSTARYLAGGTDLMIQLRRGVLGAEHIVDLSAIDSMRKIDLRRDSILIGALCTHKRLERAPELQVHYPGLCAAARVIGGHQIRNVGTVGGNIANASPAADVATALLALDARLHLFGVTGRRTIGIDEFFVAPGETALRPGELIESVELSNRERQFANTFLKVGRRKAMEIAVVCVSMSLQLDNEGRISTACISMGSVGPRPLRAREAESELIGRVPDAETAQIAGKIASGECSPRTDVRASAEYRRNLVKSLVAKALAQCDEMLVKRQGQK